MIDTLPHEQLIRMCVTLWAIWHARRKAIHEGVFQSPLSVHGFLESFNSELDQVKKQARAERQASTATSRRLRWCPPPAGVVKINTDATTARNMVAGVVAAVGRSDTGAFMGASAVPVEGLCEPETLEAMAISEGVCLV